MLITEDKYADGKTNIQGVRSSEWWSQIEEVVDSWDLEQCEEAIQSSLGRFYAIGCALARIRDNEWYKKRGYSSFEEYCINRWGFKKHYASRLIGAKNIMNNLLPIGNSETSTLPENEAQLRELNGLNREDQVKVWLEAVETAPNGKPTASHIKQTRERLLITKEEERPKPKKHRISPAENQQKELIAKRKLEEEQNKLPVIKAIEKAKEELPYEDEEEELNTVSDNSPEADEDIDEWDYNPVITIAYKSDDKHICNIVERASIYELTDSVIADRIRDFHIVTNALLRIKREELYRKYSLTFEAYCEKFGIVLNSV